MRLKRLLLKTVLLLLVGMFFYPIVCNSQNILEESYSSDIANEKLNVVKSIEFKAKSDGTALISIETTYPVDYKELEPEDNKYTIKLSEVILPQELQVARDVTEFPTPVSFVSSFRDPLKEDDVLIVVEFKEHVLEPEVAQMGNILELAFEEPEEEGTGIKKDEDEWAFEFDVKTRPGAEVPYRGERISFDFKDADIRDVLRIISDISGFNMVVSEDVSGKVTLKLHNVPWDQALDVILENAGLGAIVEGNVLKVASLKTLQARQSAMSRAVQSREKLEPLVTKQVFINYAKAEELVPLATPLLSSRGEMRIDVRTNSILVTDTRVRVNEIEELLKSLDTRTPQVLIESRIVQATLDFTRELGVQWGFNYRASAATGNPTGATFPSDVTVGGTNVGSPFGTAGDGFIVDLPAAAGTGAGGVLGIVLGSITGAYDLDIRLSALESRGDGRVLSSPKVLTLDNIPARIEQGVSIPFLSVSAAGTQTQFVDATLRLEVTPHVTNDNRILMDIKVTDNAPDPTLVGANGQPSIRRNEAETRVLASDGETIVIGGIFTRSVTDSMAGVPWFSRIPLFGWLFSTQEKRDERRELIVFITPRIIR